MNYNYQRHYFQLLGMLLLFFGLNAYSQVDFKVALNNDTYEVSLRPSTTWTGNQALTATAQITLVAPTGGFEVSNLQSISGVWSANSTVIAPEENPEQDYFTVGLTSLGTLDIPYVTDQEVLLFSFENSGTCTGAVELMTGDDPFNPPNTQDINVGNQITTLGSGNINAWTGNYDVGSANCDTAVDVDGCQDPNACNFNPDATQDDGTCDLGNQNCPDPCNVIAGCTDPAADNFDATANCDDGSCTTTPGTDPAIIYEIVQNDDGCYSINLIPNISWTGVEATTATAQVTLVVSNDFELNNLQSVSGIWANNANITAPTENPEFNYVIFGLTSLGTQDIAYNEGQTTTLFTFCNSSECVSSINLMESDDPFATPNSQDVNVGNQITTLGSGNTNAWASNQGAIANDCSPAVISGCTDLTACNYNADATEDDGSCVIIVPGTISTNDNTTNCSGDGVDDIVTATISGQQGEVLFVITDGTATTILGQNATGEFNTEPAPAGNCLIWAVVHDGSLNAPTDQVADLEGCFQLSNSIEVVRQQSGCTDPNADNFDANAQCDDGSCITTPDPILGCTDPLACNYNEEATQDDDSCDLGQVDCPDPCNVIAGCTDPGADNFDTTANCDDGSCITTPGVDPAITYEIIQNDDGCYSINLIPNISWTGIEATTATAQVTLVVSSDFELNNLQSVSGIWANNANITAPTENPEFNYVIFGLTSLGTQDIAYNEGQTTTLFTFCNSSECVSSINLMESDDPFATPNSQDVNVGNQITTLGSGNINAWAANQGAIANDCSPAAILGCTDVAACNYNADATEDDGSCVIIVAGNISTDDNTTNCSGDGVDDIVTATISGQQGEVLFVITDGTATTILGQNTTGEFNTEPAPAGNCLIWAVVHDGSLNAPTDQVADLEGCFQLSNSIEVVRQQSGCTDPNADNFDANAQCDDGSCITTPGVDPAITYEIIQNDDGCYSINLIPNISWTGTEATTATAQVTLVVSSDFELTNLQSVSGIWANNSNITAPTENPEFNYVNFGLTSLGTQDIAYNEGQTTTLFTFCNSSECVSSINLMESDDPFATPNSQDVNVGNQITTLGSGNINAWAANQGAIANDCSPAAIAGCTDAAACNYNADATEDDGSCVIIVPGTISTNDNTTNCSGDGVDDIVTATISGQQGEVLFVITDGTATTILGQNATGEFNTEPAPAGNCLIWAVVHDGSLNAPTDQVADLEGCFQLSNSIEVVRQQSGCTDPDADNFDANAQCDDGSCITTPGVDPAITYEIIQNDDGCYSINLIPNISWTGVDATTATAQVTLVVSSDFELTNLQSVSGIWANNSNITAPTENPEFNYVNFGLTSLGTQDIAYNEGQTTTLFTFCNSSECVSSINLMESDDPFATPNSQDVNVGNQITTLGSGNTNAWAANQGAIANDCSPAAILGCTDVAACNYNADATEDDGSCVIITPGTISTNDNTTNCSGDGVDDIVTATISGQQGEVLFVITDGTATTILGQNATGEFNTEPAPAGNCLIWAVVHDGSLNAPTDQVADLEGCFQLSNSIEVVRQQSGCTDPNADNFDANAQCDDGSCITTPGVDPAITYEIIQNDDGCYSINLIPNISWTGVEATTATAQVTLVVSSDFELTNLQSVSGIWANNSNITAPTENPEFNYVNFGLTSLGTQDIAYNEGQTTTLFTFCNSSECVSSINLMESDDPFATPNSQDVNVGNQITTLGSGNTNAWAANQGAIANDCSPAAIAGCTDAAACNYNADATEDDGSCIIIVAGTISTNDNTTNCSGDGVDDIVTATISGQQGEVLFVITDGTATTILGQNTTGEFNTEPAPAGNCLIWAVVHDGSLNAPTDQVADLEGCFQLSNSIEVVRQQSGCTDPAANNFDANAQCDDGSCIIDITGIVFELSENADGCYEVAMIPEETLTGPLALTATAQVTLVISDEGFELDNLENINGQWNYNGFIPNPEENPDFEYHSFGLTSLGTDEITYTANTREVLFTFCNSGECVSTIDLMEADDPFSPPNSTNTNVGNQITTLAGGNVNAWTANIGSIENNCNPGCTDLTACNYNPDAAVNDGSCEFVTCLVDISVDKSVDNAEVLVGEQVVFTITVSNQGPGLATGIEVTDLLPEGLDYNSSAISEGVYSVASGIWAVDELAAGQTETLDLTVTVSQVGEIFNIAELTALNESDLDSAPNNGLENEDDYSSASVTATPTEETLGCTNPDACNYNADATEDDGSCDLGNADCADPCNFIAGCTDPAASNYNADADCDDGSCILIGGGEGEDVDFIVTLLPDGTYQVSIIPNVTWTGADATTATAQVTLVVTAQQGFTIDNIQNVNGTWALNPIIVSPAENPDGEYVSFGLTSLGTTDIEYIEGQEVILFTFTNTGDCVTNIELMRREDPFMAPNSLNVNVGNQLTTLGSGNTNAWSGNELQLTEDCTTLNDLGCTNPDACNYDANAIEDDGSCDIGNTNCPDPCNVILGCTNADATNFDATATCDDGSCITPPMEGFVDFVLTENADGCYEVSLLSGITWTDGDDLTATAQVTLVISGEGFVLDNLQSVNGVWNNNSTILNPSENPEFEYYNFGLTSLGTGDIAYIDGQQEVLFTFCNIGECVSSITLMEVDDPFVAPNSEGVNVGNQITTLGSGNINAWAANQGSIQNNCNEDTPLLGCTDATACNYNADATEDDGSCDFGNVDCADPCNDVLGCTDPTAINYNADATCDDGSCTDPVDAELTYTISETADGCYQVGLIPSVTWTGPTAITSTAQVTLVISNEGFVLDNLQSVNGTWDNNGAIIGPDENPDFEYLSFGLTSLGTTEIDFVAGQEEILFTFCNAGECVSSISLMEAADPFAVPNSQDVNVGNQITVLAAGNTNAWTGNEGEIITDCSPDIPGCTDAIACNFNPNATEDDGSCDFGITSCNNPCNAVLGCPDPTAENYNPNSNCDDGTCIYPEEPILGCNDLTACNFDPTATQNDGSCEFGETQCPDPCNTTFGCTNPDADNYNPNANCEDNTCLFTEDSILGCTDPLACNYLATATEDDGSCEFGNSDCTDPCNEVFGCTDPFADNYNANATCDDGSCETIIGGCSDATACNFDPTANQEDGSCIYGNADCPEPCNVISGCTDPTATNYNSDATCDNGTCNYSIEGCTSPIACNYNPEATINDGSCEFGTFNCPLPCDVILGCTDPLAANYDPAATCDDNSCVNDPVALDCGISYTAEADKCRSFCTGKITFEIADGLADGTNQWFFELFNTPDLSGSPIRRDATKFPPVIFKGLCSGIYSFRITGLAGDVAGCSVEVLNFDMEVECPGDELTNIDDGPDGPIDEPTVIPVDTVVFEPGPCNIGYSTISTLCDENCAGQIVLNPGDGAVNGTNQWMVELYVDGVLTEINATVNPIDRFDELCAGFYDIVIVGIAGDVEGCIQEINGIEITDDCDDDDDPTDEPVDPVIEYVDTIGIGSGACELAGMYVKNNCDISSFCTGEIQLTVTDEVFVTGSNQWLIELYSGGNFEGDLLEINATKNPDEKIKNLCDGVYSVRIVGIAGDIAGCMQEFTNITIECKGSPDETEEGAVIAEDEPVMETEELFVCTNPLEPIDICSDLAEILNYTITEGSSSLGGSVAIISETCIRYISVPTIGPGEVDVVSLTACDSEGNCTTITVNITIGDCDGAGLEAPTDGTEIVENQEAEKANRTAPESNKLSASMDQVSIANVFTPNGDGINDILEIEGIESLRNTNIAIEFIIFDQSGKLVLQSREFENRLYWNGQFENTGVDMLEGAYYYIFRLTTNDGKVEKTGYVELRR